VWTRLNGGGENLFGETPNGTRGRVCSPDLRAEARDVMRDVASISTERGKLQKVYSAEHAVGLPKASVPICETCSLPLTGAWHSRLYKFPIHCSQYELLKT
jgi:hypothetical protein